ncbi:curli production assembly/transport component CsgF [uncultured Winogradskyella sp.]|uniref:curli production assembly/transport component CsgF n=1 Tax=uncultured Winogradskyella sp. TaxID=395353 RepID=UPI0035156C15
MKKAFLCFCLVFFIGSADLFSQQLVYRPVNPMFGGDTFNYQFLLQSAQAQNSFTAANDFDRFNDQSEIERFAESLNRQLLSQLSRNLFTAQFGVSGELRPGTFSFGSLSLEIFESTEGLVVDILDTSNGDRTQIILPNNN